jgi:hypothetical protein
VSVDAVSTRNGPELLAYAAEAMRILRMFAGLALLESIPMLTELLATVLQARFTMRPL